MSTSAEFDQEHPQTFASERAILEYMQSSNAGPGDHMDIFVAQYEIERRGIEYSQFSSGMAQLLKRGVISLMGSAFFLTDAGYAALKRDKGVGMCRGSKEGNAAGNRNTRR